MKLPIIRRSPALVALVLTSATLCLVAWSPPTGEDINANRGNLILRDSNQAANNFGSSHSTIVAGFDNTMGNNYQGSWRTVNVGQGNTTLGSNNIAIGQSNVVRGPGANDPAFQSAAIGTSNIVNATYGWTMGFANTASANRGVAIGSGATANVLAGVAIGQFNANMASTDVLAIGSGTGDTSRFTAFKVTSSGGVILGKAQGDISMGAYSN